MPRDGWCEQRPWDWVLATKAAVREAMASCGASADEIGGIGFSGQMHGSVFLSSLADPADANAVIRPALLWNDQRTATQCEEIAAAAGGMGKLVGLVGNAALTGFTLPKVVWLRENEPRNFERVRCVMTPKDYVRFVITGEAAIDVGDASGTLLVDPATRGYCAEVMRALKLDAGLFPRIVESAARAGVLSAWAAGELGLRSGIPVAAGSGDNMMGAIGAGVVEAGMALSTIGTSGVIYSHAEVCRKDVAGSGRVHTMCAANGTATKAGQWCMTGCTLSAGGALKWVKETMFPEVSYEQLMSEAGKVAAGSEGLCFLPHLTGERSPFADPKARGAFVGLTLRHGRGHLVRSVMEGVTFTLAQILEIQESMGVKVDVVRLGGGGAKSAVWKQMQADVFGKPAVLTNTEEGPAYGAALVGGVVAGAWGSVEEACRVCVREVERIEPRESGEYGRARKVFGHLYDDLRAAMHELSGD